MKSKNILIINEYAGSLEYGMSYRHYYLAREFRKLKYNVTIVTASYSHFLKKYPDMKEQTFMPEDIEGITYLWVKVMEYTKSFDKKRVLKWFEFMSKLFFISKHLEYTPDIIICSPTAPFSILPAYFLAKKYKAKLVFEVRDIWPLTLTEVGGFSKYHPLILMMSWFEKFALIKSDIIVSNLQNYTRHINHLGIKKESHWISNGINLDEMSAIEPLSDSTTNQIPKNKFIVGYTGKLGVSNAVNYLIDTAEKLSDNKEIYFVIVGDGQEKISLKTRSSKLNNIVFIDSIKKSQVQTILALFDICYIGWNDEYIYNYGVSPNKIFDYMYASKPILHSINTSKDLVSLSNCGISVQAENINEIAQAILDFYNMPKSERKTLGENGYKMVINNFTYTYLAKKYVKLLIPK